MKRLLRRLIDRVYLVFTASPEDARHYWNMRKDPAQSVRQAPIPVKTARLLSTLAQRTESAVVFGSTSSALALLDLGCSVTLVESDSGRAFGAEFHSDQQQRGLLSTVVIDRGSSEGRESYVHAYRDGSSRPPLVVIGGRSRTAVVRSVMGHAPQGSSLIVIGGGRDRYRELRSALRELGADFELHVGPSANGSARRCTAIVIPVN